MNRSISVCSAAVNLAAVLCFAVSMLFRNHFLSYFSALFIAFSFVPMICAFTLQAPPARRLAGFCAAAFAAMYAAVISLVYFAQLTTVRLADLSPEAASLLDFQAFGLLFHYDMLGYALMAASTFFAGLSISPRGKPEKWLKWLLLLHGVFFFSCLLLPMLGIFQAGQPDIFGILVLEFWCLYFSPISLLSILHFSKT